MSKEPELADEIGKLKARIIKLEKCQKAIKEFFAAKRYLEICNAEDAHRDATIYMEKAEKNLKQLIK